MGGGGGGEGGWPFESHPPDSPSAKRFKPTVAVVRGVGHGGGVRSKGAMFSRRGGSVGIFRFRFRSFFSLAGLLVPIVYDISLPHELAVCLLKA